MRYLYLAMTIVSLGAGVAALGGTSACMSCTAVAYDSTLIIDFGPRSLYPAGSTLHARVCLGDENCQQAPLPAEGCTASTRSSIACVHEGDVALPVSFGYLETEPDAVSVTLFDGDTMLFARDQNVSFRADYKNGDGCEPPAYSGGTSVRP